MIELSLVFLAVAVVVAVFSIMVQRAAYHNGVNDGYGYSREPHNHGYRLAGEYLRNVCVHRWPELDPNRPRPTVAELEAILRKKNIKIGVRMDGSFYNYSEDMNGPEYDDLDPRLNERGASM